MESAVPLLLFLGFLFGSTLLILILGIQSREEEKREASEAEARSFDVRTGSSFFASLEPSAAVPGRAFAASGMMRRVEDHLSKERTLAAGFVTQPSMETLFQGSAPQADAAVVRLEHFLQDECRQAAAFVSAPSAERLLDGSTDFIGFVPRSTTTSKDRAGSAPGQESR
ncbi:MAG: hypothetical protein ACYTG6_00290 [Planctomycetota bacterium]|jgi:hypothetical protein